MTGPCHQPVLANGLLFKGWLLLGQPPALLQIVKDPESRQRLTVSTAGPDALAAGESILPTPTDIAGDSAAVPAPRAGDSGVPAADARSPNPCHSVFCDNTYIMNIVVTVPRKNPSPNTVDSFQNLVLPEGLEPPTLR